MAMSYILRYCVSSSVNKFGFSSAEQHSPSSYSNFPDKRVLFYANELPDNEVRLQGNFEAKVQKVVPKCTSSLFSHPLFDDNR